MTIIMVSREINMSGEIEYGDIFFKDKPPLGWGNDWDQNWEKVPFPAVTYTMFLAFVICITFVAFNVLVGLTVDDIRNFLGNADLRKLTMRLEFIRQMEQVGRNPWTMIKKKKTLNNKITKETSFGAMIWKEIEKRQTERRNTGKIEEELSTMHARIQELKEIQQSKMNELKEMLINTNNLIAEIKSSQQKQLKG